MSCPGYRATSQPPPCQRALTAVPSPGQLLILCAIAVCLACDK